MKRLGRCLKRLLFWLCGTLGLLAAFLWYASRTSEPAVPDGVRKTTHTVTLTGAPVRLDLYLPRDVRDAPLAVVAHGFSRGRRNMTGWGGRLAREGFITAVLDQPWWLAHMRNGRAIAELVQQLRAGQVAPEVRPGRKAVLIGMSMGGLTTLLAAKRLPVDAWVGLDPVDISGGGVIAASGLEIPCAIVSAEPAAWNWNGNPRKIQAAFPQPIFAIKVKNSTHCDSEWPHDLLGQLACGRTDESRRRVYEEYVVAFLRAKVLGDTAADQTLAAAASDARVDLLSQADR